MTTSSKTNKQKKEKSIVKVPILNDEYFVYVLWGNAKSARNWTELYYGDNLDLSEFTEGRGRTFYHKGLYPVIWLNTKEHRMATLAHEAIHAVSSIWEDIGETYHGEVFAHSVGAIVYAVEKL